MSLKISAPLLKSAAIPKKTDTPLAVGSSATATPTAPVTASIKPPASAAVQPAEKVQNSYKQLSHAAGDLNTASDELAKPIKSMKRLPRWRSRLLGIVWRRPRSTSGASIY